MRITYVTLGRVDTDTAGLQRVLGVSAALAEAGHDVLVGGQGPAVRQSTPYPNVHLDGFGQGGQSRARRVLSAHGAAGWLTSLPEHSDLVIVYGGSGRLTQIVRRWAGRGEIPRVIDSVEWYERSHMPGGAWGPKAIDNEISMRLRYPAHDGAIAISSFLETHYRRQGVKLVARVPPVTDVKTIRAPVKTNGGPLTLLYAGSPGAKDSLGKVVQAIQQIDPVGARIRLEVLGVTPDGAAALPGMPTHLPDSVMFRGRVPRQKVIQALAHAHYVPIIREDRRYAHAGFPTKLVEAMASGTAVIANHTSDLAIHLRHRETGIVVIDDSVDAVAAALDEVADGGHQLAADLGRAAREEAMSAFDYRNHAETMDQFVRRAVEAGS